MHPVDAELANQPIRRLQRTEYHALAELGAFDDQRVELLHGRIVEMSPQKGRHAGTVRRVADLLMRAVGERALVQAPLPLAATVDSEPEPDVAIVDRREYGDQHPDAAHLVIEVSESSLARDLRIKAPLYAAMPVPEYWVVDLGRDELIVHVDPARDSYGTITHHARGATVRLVRFPDIEIAVADLLPPI
jgi:Uma2 family endonuclease